MRTKMLAVPFAVALLLGFSACSDDPDESVQETVENAGDNLEETASDASDRAGDLLDDAGDVLDDATRSAVETAARNLASAQGEDEFSSNGIEVEGDLECEADAQEDKGAVEITCTGTGTEGQSLTLEGTTSEMPGASLTELEGEFTGTADDEEIFTVDTLGG